MSLSIRVGGFVVLRRSQPVSFTRTALLVLYAANNTA